MSILGLRAVILEIGENPIELSDAAEFILQNLK
jgi:hypothetical protein